MKKLLKLSRQGLKAGGQSGAGMEGRGDKEDRISEEEMGTARFEVSSGKLGKWSARTYLWERGMELKEVLIRDCPRGLRAGLWKAEGGT